MYSLGNRVIYETSTGRIYFQTGEITESSLPVSHPSIEGLDYVDLELNGFDQNRYYIKSINVETKQPILAQYDWYQEPKSAEEVIANKEEELALLKAEQEIGGIA